MAKPQRYFGSAVSSLDAKNRINVPAKFRSRFPVSQDNKVFVYVMPGPDFRHLEVFDSEQGERRVDELTGGHGLPDAQQRSRQSLLGLVEQVELDGQGRILLPKHLVDYARLKGEVIVSGAGDHLQICDPDEARTQSVPVHPDQLDPTQIAEIYNGAMPKQA
ncbi:MAG: hypothetical protein HS108_14065 [Planctomycetes bacterium]|jgi:MraZ protein|nr:hypothetical protein [Planctomycetota bacterium]MCL4730971.1 hypothetical protein [Planctomycetota bacterium]